MSATAKLSDERTLREQIADEILAAGIYPQANSAYEKALNAQARYLAKVVRGD